MVVASVVRLTDQAATQHPLQTLPGYLPAVNRSLMLWAELATGVQSGPARPTAATQNHPFARPKGWPG